MHFVNNDVWIIIYDLFDKHRLQMMRPCVRVFIESYEMWGSSKINSNDMPPDTADIFKYSGLGN